MGGTIWVLTEGILDDDWDHSLVLRQEKFLDNISKSFGVKKLSEFFDYSAYAEEFGEDLSPNYVDSSEALKTLEALIQALRLGHPTSDSKQNENLVAELVDIFEKINKAKKSKRRVRLSLIQ